MGTKQLEVAYLMERLVITVLIVAAYIAAMTTGHLTGQTQTFLDSMIVLVLGYWFAGAQLAKQATQFLSSAQAPATQPAANTPQPVEPAPTTPVPAAAPIAPVPDPVLPQIPQATGFAEPTVTNP